MQSHQAPFITLEGIDGAGKSSHMATLRAAFAEAGLELVETREPGGTDLGSRLRHELKHTPMATDTQLLIAFADRAEHLSQKILPALAAGKAVLSDRFTDSTFAYQGGGEGVDWEKIETLERVVQGNFGPDLTLFFDLPTEVAENRREGRKEAQPDEKLDIFDEKKEAWFQKVRAAYQRRAANEPGRFLHINAAATLEEVAAEVSNGVRAFLASWPAIAEERARATAVIEAFLANPTPTNTEASTAATAFAKLQARPLSYSELSQGFNALRAERFNPAEVKLGLMAAQRDGAVVDHAWRHRPETALDSVRRAPKP